MNTSPCTPNPVLSSICSHGTKCCADRMHPELDKSGQIRPKPANHQTTGHECSYPKPERWEVPSEFTIHVSQTLQCEASEWEDPDRVCDKGTKECIFDHVADDVGTWYAQIVGQVDGEEWRQTTFGETPGQAVFMAYDLVKMMRDECNPDDEPGVPHCYCRDTTYAPSFMLDDQPDVVQYKQCCRCENQHIAEDFDADR